MTGGDAAHNPSIDDGEDLFTVFYLQSMNVGARSARADRRPPPCIRRPQPDPRRPGRHRLLPHLHDWQPFSARNYVINVLDTGAANDGVDELDIYGRDNHDPTYNGYEPGTVTRNRTTTSSCSVP